MNRIVYLLPCVLLLFCGCANNEVSGTDESAFIDTEYEMSSEYQFYNLDISDTLDMQQDKEPYVYLEDSEATGSPVVDDDEDLIYDEEIIADEVPTEEQVIENTESTIITTQEESFDCVFLGNSVTCNELSDLWWSNCGMAATDDTRDYVHLLWNWLEEKKGKCFVKTVDLKSWELAQERDAELDKYKSCLSIDSDLVVVQCGENMASNKKSINADFSSLFSTIKKNAPNACILVLGGFLWPDTEVEAAKVDACEKSGVTFVDVSEFLKDYESKYKSSVGTEVSGIDGQKHSIDNEVVAAHPNDAGMRCIAQIIINKLSEIYK